MLKMGKKKFFKILPNNNVFIDEKSLQVPYDKTNNFYHSIRDLLKVFWSDSINEV